MQKDNEERDNKRHSQRRGEKNGETERKESRNGGKEQVSKAEATNKARFIRDN